MSNSFVNSQLFSSKEKKDSHLRANFYTYGYYSSVLEGKMTYTEWKNLSPKEKDLVLESQEEIRKIQNEVWKKINNPENKEKIIN